MNKRYYRLRERLKHTELMIEHFLDVEKHRTISKKARKALNRDKPFLGLIFIILYLPTRVLDENIYETNLIQKIQSQTYKYVFFDKKKINNYPRYVSLKKDYRPKIEEMKNNGHSLTLRETPQGHELNSENLKELHDFFNS